MAEQSGLLCSQPWLPVVAATAWSRPLSGQFVHLQLLRCNLSASLAVRSYGGLIASIRGAMYHRRSTGIGRSKSEARCAMTLLPHVDRATFKTQHPLKPLGMGKFPMMSPIQDKEKERFRFTL